jgi:hypothetical protein
MGTLRSVYRRLVPRQIRRIIGGPTRSELKRQIDSVSEKGVHAISASAEPEALSLAELELLAAQIPSMGANQIRGTLRSAARNAPSGSAIVEVGTWLGAGTAQLALGLRERSSNGSIRIHCYDRWEANKSEVEKAARNGLVDLRPGQDTLPLVKAALEPFNVPISFVKGDIGDAIWDGDPISVYLDDAAKLPKKFFHVLKTFGPSWIPTVTLLILMDYYTWRKTEDAEHKCQTNFIENYRSHFEPVANFRRGSNAAFLYTKRIDFERLQYRSLLSGPTA